MNVLFAILAVIGAIVLIGALLQLLNWLVREAPPSLPTALLQLLNWLLG